jgi:hypothetical protein
MQRETQTMQQLNHKNVIRYWATSMYAASERCPLEADGGLLGKAVLPSRFVDPGD